MADEPVFDIGLVMAGAISAGAYTAGALDFLIEALEAWQRAKDAGEAVPSHGARIAVMAGASAGGICGAVAAVALGHDFAHVTPRNLGQATNPLFQSWVKSIDIAPLLETDDLEDGQPLFSLLNTRRLDEIVAAVLATSGAPKARPYVADPLPVRLSVGNLRGVPYAFGLKGNTGAGHAMSLHGDDASFAIADARPADLKPGWTWLRRPNGAAWAEFGTAALATGAFPLFLRARGLVRESHAVLDHRRFVLPGDGTTDPVTGPAKVIEIPAAWPAPKPDPAAPYKFLCVDGGIIDNEPLGLAHEILAGGPLGRNPRAGEKASRALLMIDPFVEDTVLGPAELAPVVKLIAPLLSAWKMQCRFKPMDLALAHAPGVYSRFLLAPSRGGDHFPGAHPCASGGLAGFLPRKFSHARLFARPAQLPALPRAPLHAAEGKPALRRVARPAMGRRVRGGGTRRPAHPHRAPAGPARGGGAAARLARGPLRSGRCGGRGRGPGRGDPRCGDQGHELVRAPLYRHRPFLRRRKRGRGRGDGRDQIRARRAASVTVR